MQFDSSSLTSKVAFVLLLRKSEMEQARTALWSLQNHFFAAASSRSSHIFAPFLQYEVVIFHEGDLTDADISELMKGLSVSSRVELVDFSYIDPSWPESVPPFQKSGYGTSEGETHFLDCWIVGLLDCCFRGLCSFAPSLSLFFFFFQSLCFT